ncbi:MAG: DUF2961 domain-containing protein [Caldilineaceae bacterium]|nr:DUF2961 domain-containing protein [Caldilineaceae bacterium]
MSGQIWYRCRWMSTRQAASTAIGRRHSVGAPASPYPTICGTGTENYLGGAWGFVPPPGQYGEFSSPFSGMPRVIRPDGLNKANQCFGLYRWHIYARPAHRHAGAGLAHAAGRQRPLYRPARRYRLHRFLVSDRTTHRLLYAAQFRVSGSDLTATVSAVTMIGARSGRLHPHRISCTPFR